MDGAGAGGAAPERRKQLTAAEAVNHKRQLAQMVERELALTGADSVTDFDGALSETGQTARLHRGSNSSVIPRSLPLWLICTSSLLRALAKPCRASAAAPAHRRSPRGTARRRTETEDEGVGALLYKGAPTGYTPGRAVEQKAYFLHGHASQCKEK